MDFGLIQDTQITLVKLLYGWGFPLCLFHPYQVGSTSL
jgi:hypothetical protein